MENAIDVEEMDAEDALGVAVKVILLQLLVNLNVKTVTEKEL